ncbi:replication protein A 70 kDa DNA-binding subunit D-like isoform X3 [Lotus japonicus]|nr:replication protein A 70 kDa DNA-binding subunit D-like isoform X3 [Lotus japonicus]
MARKTSLIAEVDDSKETWKLGVRITNLWVVEKSSKVNAMEMIFMDQKGGKITAIVKKFDIDKWKSMLKEDNTYIVQNFEVNHNDGQFRTSNHPYKLVFMKGTIVQARQIPEIPHNIYHFTPFDDILAGGASTEVLVDVIGELSDVVQIQKESVPKRVVLVLKDERNNTLHCTLWENYAARMISFLETHVEGHVVILLSLAKIKETNGKYPTTIQNSMYCSKLFIDEPLAEIQEYKNRLGSICVNESYSQKMSQFSSCSQFTSEEKFVQNDIVKSLSQLNEVQKECYVVTVAKIDKVCVGNGWSYEACFKCNRKADCSSLPFTCPKCGKKNTETVPRFRVEVMVSYNNNSSKFVLWDRECIQLVKQTAIDLKKQLLDEGEFDAMAVPEPIDCILGKLFAFKVKVQPGYKQFSVTGVSDNEKTIESIRDKLQVDEDSLMSKKGKSISSFLKEDDAYEIQSLSATADSDTTSIGHCTPAKRLSKDTLDDDFACQDLPSVQLSSSKVTKHIKTE